MTTCNLEIFSNPDSWAGRRVHLVGRIVSMRTVGPHLSFVLLGTDAGEIQCVLEGPEVVERVGSILQVEGVLRQSNARNGLAGYELSACQAEVISSAEELPFQPRSQPPHRALRQRYRHLDLRNPRVAAVFRIRSEVLWSARTFLHSEGFTEVTTPKIVAGMAEGPLEKFGIQYFGRQAWLTVSGLLYQGIAIAGDLRRVCEIGPVFYAEESRRPHNLNEFSVIEFSVAYATREDLMLITERLLSAIFRHVTEACADALATLAVAPPTLPHPVPRFTYREMICALRERGVDLKWGQSRDFPADARRVFADISRGFFWLLDQPHEVKWFFVRGRQEDDLAVSSDCQLWGPFACQLAEGSERENRPDKLVDNLRQRGENPESFKAYIDAMRHGAPPFSGIGLGVERLLMTLVDAGNIRDVVLFPRSPECLEP